MNLLMQIGWWTDFLNWLKDLLLWVPKKIWDLLLQGLGAVLEAIPVPDFMSNLGSFVAGIDPSIAYFAAPLHVGTGITMVLTAYAIRFVIRRLPVVG